MGQSLRLADAREMTPAVESLGSSALAMRQAAIDAISIDDITEIIRKQVEKAKGGDAAAAKFVLDYATGGSAKVQINVKSGPGQPPKESGPPALVMNGTGKRREPEQAPKPKTVGEIRRSVARYLAKNGPASEEALSELFKIDPSEAETLFMHEWFGRCKEGWHLSAIGRKENA